MIAKHAFYIFDCCLSGLGLSSSGTLSVHQEDYLQKIMASKAHQVLTAGRKGQQVTLIGFLVTGGVIRVAGPGFPDTGDSGNMKIPERSR